MVGRTCAGSGRSRARRQGASKPVKAVVRNDKYQHVQAKVVVHTQPSPAFQLEPTAGAPQVPPNGTPALEGGASLQQGGGGKNFLAANIEGAGRHHVRRPPSREKVEQTQARREREMGQYRRGKVPQNLRQRQDQWRQEEEQRKAMEPDPSVPPGHTLMPAEERRRTLQLLSETRDPDEGAPVPSPAHRHPEGAASEDRARGPAGGGGGRPQDILQTQSLVVLTLMTLIGVYRRSRSGERDSSSNDAIHHLCLLHCLRGSLLW